MVDSAPSGFAETFTLTETLLVQRSGNTAASRPLTNLADYAGADGRVPAGATYPVRALSSRRPGSTPPGPSGASPASTGSPAGETGYYFRSNRDGGCLRPSLGNFTRIKVLRDGAR